MLILELPCEGPLSAGRPAVSKSAFSFKISYENESILELPCGGGSSGWLAGWCCIGVATVAAVLVACGVASFPDSFRRV